MGLSMPTFPAGAGTLPEWGNLLPKAYSTGDVPKCDHKGTGEVGRWPKSIPLSPLNPRNTELGRQQATLPKNSL